MPKGVKGFYTDEKGRKRPITKKTGKTRSTGGLPKSELNELYMESHKLATWDDWAFDEYWEHAEKTLNTDDEGEIEEFIEDMSTDQVEKVMDMLDTAIQKEKHPEAKKHLQEAMRLADERDESGDWYYVHNEIYQAGLARFGGQFKGRLTKERVDQYTKEYYAGKLTYLEMDVLQNTAEKSAPEFRDLIQEVKETGL